VSGPTIRIDVDYQGALAQLGREYDQMTTLGELQQRVFETEWEVIQLQSKLEKQALVCETLKSKWSISPINILYSWDPNCHKIPRLDNGVLTDPVVDLDSLKKKLCSNTDSAARACMLNQEASDIAQVIDQKGIELEVLEMSNHRLAEELQRLLTKIKLSDPITSRELKSHRRRNLEEQITEAKDKRIARLSKLRERKTRANERLNQYMKEIRDLEYLVQIKRTELIDKTRKEKASVRELVDSRMSDRSVLDGLSRLSALVRVETTEIEKAISRHGDCFSSEGNERIHEKNEALHTQLEHLKTRFRTSRAVKEVRTIVLTSEEDMKDFQARIRTLSSAIDVGKMRRTGILAKIEKQMRQLKEASIRIPEPPEAYYGAHRAVANQT
jgi:hypothetical protein